jgi:hypothetical protein
MQDGDIDDLLARARAAPPEPETALLTRIEAEARWLQLAFRAPPAAPAAGPGALGRWIAALGGGPALAGLASAVLVGLWIGTAQPAPVAAVTTGVSAALGQETDVEYIDLMPDFGGLAAEG